MTEFESALTDRVLLYVEDEDAAAFLMETALQEAGIQVRMYRVANGEQAICFLRREGDYRAAPTPDLVLLDLNLPKVDGFQVLQAIGRNGKIQPVPVIVFTSSCLAADRTKALALGAEQFVTKPLSLDDFVSTVTRMCSRLN